MRRVSRCICVIIILVGLHCFANIAFADAMSQIHSGDPAVSVPLYEYASFESPVICRCTNWQYVQVDGVPINDFIHVRIGAVGYYPVEYMPFEISGYIPVSMINNPQNADLPIQYINPQVNTPQMEIGAPIWDSTGQIMGHIQNSQRVNLLAEYSNGYCFVRCSSSYIDNMSPGVIVYGFVSKDILSPLDSSPAYCPYDQQLPLEVHTYTIRNSIPDNMTTVLNELGWSEDCPSIGGICALDGNQAFIMWESGISKQINLTYLEQIGSDWEVSESVEFLVYGTMATKCLFTDSNTVTLYYGTSENIMAATARIVLKRHRSEAGKNEWSLSEIIINTSSLDVIAYCDRLVTNRYRVTLECGCLDTTHSVTFETEGNVHNSAPQAPSLLSEIYSIASLMCDSD